MDTPLTRHAGIALPVLGGAMYPCSNPELVAAVSAAGGMGILQPIALTYVHGHDFREGIRLMRRLAGGRPIGMNALIESAARTYHERMVKWVDIALEEGIRFFVTSLGNPRWVCERVHAAGGIVYHDVTEARWARKGVDGGCDGLIGVNAEAGGHAGSRSPEALFEELAPFGLPVVCAGGVGDAAAYARALAIGYAGVQVGTRLIATTECTAHARYKDALVRARATDIVLTERLTGIPVAVINTPYVQRLGTRVGPLTRALLRGRRTKRWMRAVFAMRSVMALRRANGRGDASRDYWQAGRSVQGIDAVEPVATVLARFRAVTSPALTSAHAP